MLSEPPVSLFVIGALHVDEIAHAAEKMIMGESNPVCWTRRVGGVAANVSRAVALTRQDINVHLIANCGTDPDGNQLRAVMQHCAIDFLSPDVADQSTGRYTAILQPGGEVLLGLADTAQAEQISFEAIAAQINLHTPRAVFFDGNLSSQTMIELCSHSTMPHSAKPYLRFGMCVSPAKAPRFIACLPALDLLFCNRSEAEAIVRQLGQPELPATRPEELLCKLCNTGCTHVVLTDGANGVYIGTGSYQSFEPVSPARQTRTLNGPGDALAGATSARLVDQSVTHSAVVDAVCRFGIPAASAVLAGDNQAPLLD